MPSFSGRVETRAPGRGGGPAGPCEVSFDARTLTLVPQAAPPVAFDLGDVDCIESGDCQIRLSLSTGEDVWLTHFGRAFQDFDRQLRDAHRDRLVACLLVGDLDEQARFNGHVRVGSAGGDWAGPAEIRLYESNLAVLPDAAVGFQWRLADIDGVEFDAAAYAVVLSRRGERLTIGRLARRTGELADQVQSRMTALVGRTARTLHALFPFLAPGPFSQAAALLREGASAPIARLAAIHPLIEPALIDKVVDARLKPYVGALADRAAVHGWFTGFKFVRREAPDEERETVAAGGPGEAAGDADADRGEMAAPPPALDPDVLDAGDGLDVLYWFFFPVAVGGGRAAHLAWEATSRGGRATYVFRLDGGDDVEAAVEALNRGLVALNFRREPVYLDGQTLESDLRYRHYAIAQRKVPDLARVRRAFAGRAIHTTPAAWSRQLDEVLSR
jgi:hypothetical protein